MCHHRLVFTAGVLLCLHGSVSSAGEIRVKPGAGTITAAVGKVRIGDVVRLEPGSYEDAVRLPPGITLRGAGADKTTVTGTEFALMITEGAEVQIEGIRFIGSEQTRRGISSDHGVRVVGCRFENIPEAVNLLAAPLSDVLYCEFVDCDMGIRAYGGASPTVWGCIFRRGRTGVFSLNGAPYVRNNLFYKVATGLHSVTAEPAVVRNNVFWQCSAAGLELTRRGDFRTSPSVRNNIFSTCGAAAIASSELLAGISHCVVHSCGEVPFRDKEGQSTLDLSGRSIVTSDPALAEDDSGTVKIGAEESLKAKDARLPSESETVVGAVGWFDGGPACRTPGKAILPPIRWEEPTLIANCVGEEYAYLRSRGLSLGQQGLVTEHGRQFDVLELDGKRTLRFDITRFFGERNFNP